MSSESLLVTASWLSMSWYEL